MESEIESLENQLKLLKTQDINSEMLLMITDKFKNSQIKS